MLNLNSIMIGTMQKEVMADFYQKVFDKEPDFKDEGYSGWQVGSCFLMIGEHSEMGGKAKEGARVMFNLETKEVEKEFNRIKEIEGVEVIKEPYNPGGPPEMLIATLSDPDGNYFQLMPPWEEEK